MKLRLRRHLTLPKKEGVIKSLKSILENVAEQLRDKGKIPYENSAEAGISFYCGTRHNREVIKAYQGLGRGLLYFVYYNINEKTGELSVEFRQGRIRFSKSLFDKSVEKSKDVRFIS